VAIRHPRRHRNGERAHQHGDRQRKTDLARIEAAGGKPYRQERQLDAKGYEKRRIKNFEPQRKTASAG
jgi:hypothetical protein